MTEASTTMLAKQSFSDAINRKILARIKIDDGRTIEIRSLAAIDILPIIATPWKEGEEENIVFGSHSHMVLHFTTCMTGLEAWQLLEMTPADAAKILVHVKAEVTPVQKALLEANLVRSNLAASPEQQ